MATEAPPPPALTLTAAEQEERDWRRWRPLLRRAALRRIVDGVQAETAAALREARAVLLALVAAELRAAEETAQEGTR